MNLMLFQTDGTQIRLPASDPRTQHVRKVLKMSMGNRFDVGLLNGPRGKALIVNDDEAGLELEITWGVEPRALMPLTLMLGLSRPQTMRKILRELPPLGVERLICFASARGEPSYRESSLWTTNEWMTQLLQGAEQAFTTCIPEVLHVDSIDEAVGVVPGAQKRIALDNYEATAPLAGEAVARESTVMAIGSERGWSAQERDVLRKHGYQLLHLGPRVLRTETAVIAGTTLVAAAMGELDALSD